MGHRLVVITGASSGIGAAAAVALARQGHRVALVARRAPALQEVADRCGPDTRVFPGDMTVRDDVQRVVADVIAVFGRIDTWINNVGQGITRMPSELTDDDVDEVMRVNVKSALYGMQEVLPHFKTRGDGHIINVSSMLGRIPYATLRSAYCGAKHFLNALTVTFRDEVRQTHPGIQFSLVSPGVVYTDFGRNALHGGPDSRDLPDGQSADEVAGVIAAVVESRAPDVYTRAGLRQRVVDYYATNGTDPE
jgi:NAD(P)-dependent dehydrogenase (short-subunit alcohol dehydrogenase family)